MSHLGKVTEVVSVCVSLRTLTTVGGATITAANGDELFVTSTGTIVPTGTPGSVTINSDLTFVGGTGRFVGATGFAKLVVQQNSISGTSTLDGKISNVGS